MFINSDEDIQNSMTPDERQNVLLTALRKELDGWIFLEKKKYMQQEGIMRNIYAQNPDLLYNTYL